jgi:hypothetical protein
MWAGWKPAAVVNRLELEVNHNGFAREAKPSQF